MYVGTSSLNTLGQHPNSYWVCAIINQEETSPLQEYSLCQGVTIFDPYPIISFSKKPVAGISVNLKKWNELWPWVCRGYCSHLLRTVHAVWCGFSNKANVRSLMQLCNKANGSEVQTGLANYWARFSHWDRIHGQKRDNPRVSLRRSLKKPQRFVVFRSFLA